MSDISEDYKALRDFNRAKKENNLKASTELLDALGIDYTSHNNGIHLKVFAGDEVVNFWPSTGKWISSDTKSRGVQKLITYVKNKQ